MKVALSILFIFIFISCDNNSVKNSNLGNIDSVSIQDINFSSDVFELSFSYQSQKEVFDAFFIDDESYQLPGNPDKATLHAFFDELRSGYFNKDEGIDYSFIRKEYHTFTHAMDVMITTHSLLESGGGVYLSASERACLVLAALGHDVLHTGVNNDFLIQVEHPYYKEIGSSSLQEKRSANYVLSLLDKHQILVVNEGMNNLLKKEISEGRELIKQSILWTDIKRHNEQMKEVSKVSDTLCEILNQQRESSKKESVGALTIDIKNEMDLSDLLTHDNRVLIGSFILHCADVSNPGKEWKDSERWAALVMNEFFSQGDLEKKLGIKPSMNCDRNSVSVPGCQIGFGKYVIFDLYSLLKKVVYDGGKYLLDNFTSNQENWQKLLNIEEDTGSPYLIKFIPPSQEGGWIGEFREGEI